MPCPVLVTALRDGGLEPSSDLKPIVCASLTKDGCAWEPVRKSCCYPVKPLPLCWNRTGRPELWSILLLLFPLVVAAVSPAPQTRTQTPSCCERGCTALLKAENSPGNTAHFPMITSPSITRAMDSLVMAPLKFWGLGWTKPLSKKWAQSWNPRYRSYKSWDLEPELGYKFSKWLWPLWRSQPKPWTWKLEFSRDMSSGSWFSALNHLLAFILEQTQVVQHLCNIFLSHCIEVEMTQGTRQWRTRALEVTFVPISVLYKHSFDIPIPTFSGFTPDLNPEHPY